MFAGDISVYFAVKMEKIYWEPSTVRTPPPYPYHSNHLKESELTWYAKLVADFSSVLYNTKTRYPAIKKPTGRGFETLYKPFLYIAETFEHLW